MRIMNTGHSGQDIILTDQDTFAERSPSRRIRWIRVLQYGNPWMNILIL